MSRSLVVVDYDAGNLRSVETALRHLGATFELSADPQRVLRADRVIVPGVGDAAAAMQVLRSRGLDLALRESVTRGVPFLGICLGSQLILDHSVEHDADCLALIPGEVPRFSPDLGLKVPHMGWNSVTWCGDHPVFAGLANGASFYFVHSYFPQPAFAETVYGWCEYGIRFAAALGRDNVVATQFHPEKSGVVGLRIIENFLRWKG